MYTTSETINNLCDIMLKEGYTLIVPKKTRSYMHFMKDNKFGYIQYAGFRFSISRSYIPSSAFGSGQCTFDSLDLPTIDNISMCFGYQLDKTINHYKGITHFLERNKYEEYNIIYPSILS